MGPRYQTTFSMAILLAEGSGGLETRLIISIGLIHNICGEYFHES